MKIEKNIFKMNENIQKLTDILVRVDEWLTNNGLSEMVTDISTFDQSWSDTSCGFGGMAGQSFTCVSTVVIELNDGRFEVFIGGRFAYEVKRPSEKFFDDLYHQYLRGMIDDKRKLYEKKEKE